MTHSVKGRRFLISLISLTAVVVVLAVGMTFVSLAGPRSAITSKNAAQIRRGMTLAQVERILCGPARSEEPFIPAWGGHPPTAFWRTRYAPVCVWLDADGKVTESRIHEAESLLDSTRRVLGL